MRKCGKYDFLINSDEFLLFSRPNGDVEKLLTKLPKMPTSAIIERVRKVTDINEKLYDLTDKERFHNALIEFSYFAKKVLSQLKAMKKSIESFKAIKTNQIGSYKILVNLFDKYEELNLSTYTENNTKRLVIGD